MLNIQGFESEQEQEQGTEKAHRENPFSAWGSPWLAHMLP